MIRRPAALVGLALMACASLAAVRAAQDGPPPLDALMGGLKHNLKLVGTALAAPERVNESLPPLREMQAIALAAKTAVPATLATLAAEEQAKRLPAYQADMARLLIELTELELDVLEGRPEAAAARIKEGLIALRDASHEKWKD